MKMDKNKFGFTLSFIFILAYSYLLYASTSINLINSTTMAFSYEYGFISRGLIGTTYGLIDKIAPIDMMTKDAVVTFIHIVTMVYMLFLFWFFLNLIRSAKVEHITIVTHLCIGFAIWAIPIFVDEQNFGRLDMYCLSLSMIMVILIISKKNEWFVIPLAAISVLIHHGNVFMFINIPLVLLLYRFLDEKEEISRKHYGRIFLTTFLSVSALFIYFEFFSYTGEQASYDTISNIACNLNGYNACDTGLISKTIFGTDLSEGETTFRIISRVQFVIFMVLMIPHMVRTYKTYRNTIRYCNSNRDKLKYIVVLFGVITIVPEMVLKCDYGRYAFMIVAYYAIVTIALIAMQDSIIASEYVLFENKIASRSKTKLFLFYWYPLLMQPVWDVDVNWITYFCGEILNATLLHWW